MRKFILAVLFFFSSIFSTIVFAGNGGVIVGFVNPDGEIVFEFEIDKEFLDTEYPIQSFLMEQGDFDYLKEIITFKNSYIITREFDEIDEFNAENNKAIVSEAIVDDNEISIFVDNDNVITFLSEDYLFRTLNSISKN